MNTYLRIGLSGLLSIAVLLVVAASMGVFDMASDALPPTVTAGDPGVSSSLPSEQSVVFASSTPTPTVAATRTPATDENVEPSSTPSDGEIALVSDVVINEEADQPDVQLVALPEPNMVLSADVYEATGGIVVFALSLTNVGLGVGIDISVRSRPPNELRYVSHVASQGEYDPIAGIWSVGEVPAGAELTLHITATSEPLVVPVQSEGATTH